MGRSVLLLIDLQNGFVKESSARVVQVVQNILRRQKFDMIIQTQWVNKENSPYVKRLFYRQLFKMESKDTALCLDIPRAKILKRCGYSCYTKDMEKLLNKDDTIYVAGLETDACVLASCFGLFDNGHTFRIIEDAVATNREELHNPTLKLMSRNFGRDTLVLSDNIVLI